MVDIDIDFKCHSDIPANIWRNWRRCVRRGYRPASLDDLLAYNAAYGSNPRQGKHMVEEPYTDIVTVKVKAWDAAVIGYKALAQLKARIEAGKSDPHFKIQGGAIWYVTRVPKKLVQRSAKP